MSKFSKRRSFTRLTQIGKPKFKQNDIVGDFTIVRYSGHSAVNRRSNTWMSKAHHWYYCLCTCGTNEYRSQQELTDKRRQQKCFNCR